MKKIFTFAAAALFVLGVSAQSKFLVSPTQDAQGEDLGLTGERMSSNRTYVVGMSFSSVPTLWNTETNEIKQIIEIDENYVDPSLWGDFETEPYSEFLPRTGSFHSVTPNGLAVGGLTDQINYIAKPILFNAATGQYVELLSDEEDAGAEAYAISEDGSTIIGFHFDADWKTHACVWTDGGNTREDLVWPSDIEAGFEVEYCSARYVSYDGKTILGYAQDNSTGSWVALVWLKGEDDHYTPKVISKEYYQTTTYDADWNPIPVADPKPYSQFEPVGLSANGEWITLVVAEYGEEGSFFTASGCARYNHVTNVLEAVFPEGEEEQAPELFGISNDGLAVGRLTGPIDWDTFSQPVNGVVWFKNSGLFHKVEELFPDDEYVSTLVSSAVSYVDGEGQYIMGYASDDQFVQTSYVVSLSESGVQGVSAKPAVENKEVEIYDVYGRKHAEMPSVRGVYIVNGEKVVK